MEQLKPTTLGLLLLAMACGPGAGQYDPNKPPPGPGINIGRPRILVAAPNNQISVGQTVAITGENFLNPRDGESVVHIKGNFTDQFGQTFPVDREMGTEFQGNTQISWMLWPNVVFHPEGNKLGTFLGELTVINRGSDGSRKESDGYPVQYDIQPSLVMRALRPARGGCTQNVVNATTDEQPFSALVEAVGLAPGQPSAPLKFYWSFFGKDWNLQVGSFGTFDPSSNIAESTVTVEDTVTDGNLSAIQDSDSCGAAVSSGVPQQSGFENWLNSWCTANASGQKRLLVKLKDDIVGTGGVKEFKTRAITDDGSAPGAVVSRGVETNITIIAVDAMGQASINVPLKIFREITLHYDGALDRVVERERPKMEHDCIPAGNLPRNYSFRVTTSETRSQDFGFNLNPQVGGQLGFVRGVNFSLAFGIDARESVSKSQEIGKDLSTEIIPGQFAVSYTQASKSVRVVTVVGHDQCGGQFDGGTVNIEQWSWAPELATGNTCPPPTHFPASGPCYENCQVTGAIVN